MAGSEFYDHTTYPSNGASGSSSAMRSELESIETGFGKHMGMSGNANKIAKVNAGATAYTASILSDDGSTATVAGALTATGAIAGASLSLTAALPVTSGGTGRLTSTTAYGLLAAGTTATGAQQTLAAGATTEILVGGGASALPVWTTASGSGAPVRATSPTLVTPTINTAVSVGGAWTAAATWTLPAYTLGGTVSLNGQSFSGTCANGGTFTTIDINGGTIDATTIGATTPSTGAFTTLSASEIISANGGQIAFPATQNPSSDANTLDDYEEGAWTPVLKDAAAGNAATASSSNGHYTKIGRMVKFQMFLLNINTAGLTAGNQIYITGLPFTASNTHIVPCCVYKSNVTSTTGGVVAVVNQNQTYITLYDELTTGSGILTVAAISSGVGDIAISGVYHV